MTVSRLETLGTALETAVPHIVFAYLFGSAAAGRLTPRSDVDIAIYVKGDANPHVTGLEAAGAAASHLGTDAVDLVVLNMHDYARLDPGIVLRVLESDVNDIDRFRVAALQAIR